MSQNFINHVALVLDASASMIPFVSKVPEVADSNIKNLAEISQKMDQETRATTYTFNSSGIIKCVYYDKDVLRMPSLKGKYETRGNTALLDATLKAIRDLQKTATLYGDHAFLVYVLTDGEENDSEVTPSSFKREISELPDNWTLATFVPNARAEQDALRVGFPAGNIMIWDQTQEGMEKVDAAIKNSTQTYMQNRAAGVRSTSGLFQLSPLVHSVVRASLPPLDPSTFWIIPVRSQSPIVIRDFVELWTKRPYVIGSAYYELSKIEEIQPQKQIRIRERRTGTVYGGLEARYLLGLPDYSVKVYPAKYTEYQIYVQSTSVNRKLVPGTSVMIDHAP